MSKLCAVGIIPFFFLLRNSYVKPPVIPAAALSHNYLINSR